MAVDDHGLEVLKKSGEEVVPNDKSDMYIKVRDVYLEAALAQILTAINNIYTIIVNNTLLFLVDDNGDQLVDDNGDNLQG